MLSTINQVTAPLLSNDLEDTFEGTTCTHPHTRAALSYIHVYISVFSAPNSVQEDTILTSSPTQKRHSTYEHTRIHTLSHDPHHDAQGDSIPPSCLPFDLPPPEEDSFVDNARKSLAITVSQTFVCIGVGECMSGFQRFRCLRGRKENLDSTWFELIHTYMHANIRVHVRARKHTCTCTCT